jgi:hypothetical protein
MGISHLAGHESLPWPRHLPQRNHPLTLESDTFDSERLDAAYFDAAYRCRVDYTPVV